MKLHRRTLKRIRSSTNYIDGVQVLWPPVATHRGEVTMDADGNRYRRCMQCEAWFSRKSDSKCPCNTATYCGRECQKKNWRVHKLHCTASKSGSTSSVTDLLVPPGEFGSRECHVMAIMNSPEFEENLRIARAKCKPEPNRRNTNSSSSSSSSSNTNLPPGAEDMRKRMVNRPMQELITYVVRQYRPEDRLQMIRELTNPEIQEQAKRSADEDEKKRDEKRAEAARQEAVRLRALMNAEKEKKAKCAVH